MTRLALPETARSAGRDVSSPQSCNGLKFGHPEASKMSRSHQSAKVRFVAIALVSLISGGPTPAASFALGSSGSDRAEQAQSEGQSRRRFNLFNPQSVQAVAMENSSRLSEMISNGKLELTLADAIAIALDNNLDIAVQRYMPSFAATDLLRTRAGQAPRGFSGASVPGGLTSGALGTGVSGAGSSSGVGSAGGITGGGGAVQIGPSGNFDPSLSLNFSWDRNTSPLNTTQVSGVPTVTGVTSAISSNYAQLLHPGTSYFLSFSGQRQSSTQQYLRYNPAYVTRLSLGVHQPLLNGFGYLPNERFIRVARNNTRVSQEVFRQQVITVVTAVSNAFWDLVAVRESHRVAEQSQAVAQRMLEDNRARLEIGTVSRIDVVASESEVAARTRDLASATAALQLQEAALKSLLIRKAGPELDAAEIIPMQDLPEPGNSGLPEFKELLTKALESRSDLRQVERAAENQELAVEYTKNALLPNLAVFGFYAGAGLQGQGPISDTGPSDALWDSLRGEFPEYAAGSSLALPLINRVAQADNLRAQLERIQLTINRQRTVNQIALEIRKALIGLNQGKVQVEAAHDSVRLAREIWEGEKSRLEAGVSTAYQVILRERDLLASQQAEVAAMVGYAKGLVELQRAIGTTLEENRIRLDDVLGEPTPGLQGTTAAEEFPSGGRD